MRYTFVRIRFRQKGDKFDTANRKSGAEQSITYCTISNISTWILDTMTLNRFLKEKRVPYEYRDRMPLVTLGEEVMFALVALFQHLLVNYVFVVDYSCSTIRKSPTYCKASRGEE